MQLSIPGLGSVTFNWTRLELNAADATSYRCLTVLLWTNVEVFMLDFWRKHVSISSISGRKCTNVSGVGTCLVAIMHAHSKTAHATLARRQTLKKIHLQQDWRLDLANANTGPTAKHEARV